MRTAGLRAGRPASAYAAAVSLGVPELLVFVALFGVAFLVLTVYACVHASQNGDSGWMVAIIAGWFVGAGWIVGLVYLLSIDRQRQVGPGLGRPLPPPSGPPVAAPASVASGWYADPAGRFELRYWDGDRWTASVARDGRQTTDPAGV